MFVKQLSVFMENREGCLEEVLEVLKKESINIISLSLADTSDYGLLRLLVDHPEKGRDALKSSGFSAMLNDVIAVKLVHKAGKLQEMLSLLHQQGINVEYMYALSTGTYDAAIAFKTSDLAKTLEVLKSQHVSFYTQSELKEIDLSE